MRKETLTSLALNLLARREHSRFELVQKLKKHSSDIEQINAVLDVLEQKDYLSEERYVSAYIHSRKNKGYGPRFIEQELIQRKVAPELIQAGLDEVSDWFETAQAAYEKKYGQAAPVDFSDKAKRMAFLQRRGFLSEHINVCMNTLPIA